MELTEEIMSYKIAVASSDGKNINETFGSVKSFIIYEVTNDEYIKSEERFFQSETTDILSDSCNSEKCNSGGCGSSCGVQSNSSEKVELVSDCRAVVCRKIGFPIQKQLERKAISAFEVSCSISEALDRIVFYYNHIDNRKSLRK